MHSSLACCSDCEKPRVQSGAKSATTPTFARVTSELSRGGLGPLTHRTGPLGHRQGSSISTRRTAVQAPETINRRTMELIQVRVLGVPGSSKRKFRNGSLGNRRPWGLWRLTGGPRQLAVSSVCSFRLLDEEVHPAVRQRLLVLPHHHTVSVFWPAPREVVCCCFDSDCMQFWIHIVRTLHQ